MICLEFILKNIILLKTCCYERWALGWARFKYAYNHYGISQTGKIVNIYEYSSLAFWHCCLSGCIRITHTKKWLPSFGLLKKMPDTIHFIANILGPILHMMREVTFERKLWGRIRKDQMTEIDRKDHCCNHTWIFLND